MHLNALVVSKSGASRASLMRFLGEAKFAHLTFTEARSVHDALLKFDSTSTDVIFLEWEFSVALGLDFLRKIRMNQRRRVPIVVIANEADMAKLEQSADVGAVDFCVVRPFTSATFGLKLAPFIARLTAPAKAAPAGNRSS